MSQRNRNTAPEIAPEIAPEKTALQILADQQEQEQKQAVINAAMKKLQGGSSWGTGLRDNEVIRTQIANRLYSGDRKFIVNCLMSIHGRNLPRFKVAKQGFYTGTKSLPNVAIKFVAGVPVTDSEIESVAKLLVDYQLAQLCEYTQTHNHEFQYEENFFLGNIKYITVDELHKGLVFQPW